MSSLDDALSRGMHGHLPEIRSKNLRKFNFPECLAKNISAETIRDAGQTILNVLRRKGPIDNDPCELWVWECALFAKSFALEQKNVLSSWYLSLLQVTNTIVFPKIICGMDTTDLLQSFVEHIVMCVPMTSSVKDACQSLCLRSNFGLNRGMRFLETRIISNSDPSCAIELCLLLLTTVPVSEQIQFFLYFLKRIEKAGTPWIYIFLKLVDSFPNIAFVLIPQISLAVDALKHIKIARKFLLDCIRVANSSHIYREEICKKLLEMYRTDTDATIRYASLKTWVPMWLEHRKRMTMELVEQFIFCLVNAVLHDTGKNVVFLSLQVLDTFCKDWPLPVSFELPVYVFIQYYEIHECKINNRSNR
jgi:hypothetical protein